MKLPNRYGDAALRAAVSLTRRPMAVPPARTPAPGLRPPFAVAQPNFGAWNNRGTYEVAVRGLAGLGGPFDFKAPRLTAPTFLTEPGANPAWEAWLAQLPTLMAQRGIPPERAGAIEGKTGNCAALTDYNEILACAEPVLAEEAGVAERDRKAAEIEVARVAEEEAIVQAAAREQERTRRCDAYQSVYTAQAAVLRAQALAIVAERTPELVKQHGLVAARVEAQRLFDATYEPAIQVWAAANPRPAECRRDARVISGTSEDVARQLALEKAIETVNRLYEEKAARETIVPEIVPEVVPDTAPAQTDPAPASASGGGVGLAIAAATAGFFVAGPPGAAAGAAIGLFLGRRASVSGLRGLGYGRYVSSHNRYAPLAGVTVQDTLRDQIGLGGIGAAPVFDRFDDILSDLGSAYRTAQNIVNDPPVGTPASVVSGWRTILKQSDGLISKLASSIGQARQGGKAGRDWAELAKLVGENLLWISEDGKKQGYYNTYTESFGLVVRGIIEKILRLARDLAVGAAEHLLAPIASSPIVWVVGLGLLAWTFRGPIAGAAQRRLARA